MSIDAIMRQIEEHRIEVELRRNSAAFAAVKPWQATLIASHHGVKMESYARANTMDEAITQAWGKLLMAMSLKAA